MNTFKKSIGLSLLLLILSVAVAGAQTMATYSWQPPIVTDASQPNTLILLSNDWTGFTRGYKNDTFYDDRIEYWGYFDSNKYYEYKKSGKSGLFQPRGFVEVGTHYVPGGLSTYWSGNFLNWISAANVDFLRKALTGGSREADSVGNTTLLRGQIANGQAWKKSHSGANLGRLVPTVYANSNYEFYNVDTTFTVRNKSNGSTVGGPFTVEVQVCVMGMLEDNCQEYPSVGEAKPQGLLHKYADKMRFGLMTYSHAKAADGGVLRKKMGDVRGEWQYATNGQQNQGINDTMIRYIENYTAKGWDPLAEMYYDAIRYFKANKGASEAYCGAGNFTADDGFPVYGCEKNKDWGDDPIIDWCQKNNIIIMNDEYPSQEHNYLPGSPFNPAYSVVTFAGGNANPYNVNVGALTKAVGDWEKAHNITSTNWYVGNILGGVEDQDCTKPKTVGDLSLAHGICPTEPDIGSKGTFFLAGLAHHAYTNDLRLDIDGKQNIRTWTLAYRATSASVYNPPDPPMNQMWLAAKYGNFEDLNNNGWPDDATATSPSEWADPDRTDKNGKPLPYAYFPADNGKQLVDAIGKIFDAILETSVSSTALSVLANAGQTEGTLVQAYYRPRYSLGETSVDWIGFMQSLWLDEFGYIREETVKDNTLNHAQDKVVRYIEQDGVAKAWIYDVSSTKKYPDFATDSYTEVELEDVEVLWDAGRILAKTDPGKRQIFTFMDKNQDGRVEERLSGLLGGTFDDSGEVVRFYDRNYRRLMPYLNVKDNILEGYLGRSQKIRALNLIRWTEGYDQEVNPTRFIDLANLKTRTRSLDGTDVYKLGDIINSNPITVAAPAGNFDILFGDETYRDYYEKYKERETVVYVGANDGMLHAFTSWKFKRDLSKFVDPNPAQSKPIGSELWSYIPQNLLPHLKWLPREDYSHVYYVDMQPKVFDARIFFNSFGTVIDPVKYPNGWGTILVGGYGIGGGSIWVNDVFDTGGSFVNQTRTFNPSYFAIDITDPRNPVLLWDRSFDGLGMSQSLPTLIRHTDANGKGVWRLVFGSGPDAGDRSLPVPPQYDGESADPAYVYLVDPLTGVPVSDASGNDYFAQTAESNAFAGHPMSLDYRFNYNTDAVYLPITYDAGTSANHDWRGGIYKLTIPWNGFFKDGPDANSTIDYYEMQSQYGDLSLGGFSSDPYDATTPTSKWRWHKLFSAPGAITGGLGASTDEKKNIWIYAGTGRLFTGGDDANSDAGDSSVNYIYGFKDSFFNRDYILGNAIGDPFFYNYTYFNTIDGSNAVKQTTAPSATSLFDSDDIVVTDKGKVYELSGGSYTKFDGTGDWKNFENTVQEYNGWRRSLRTETDASGQLRAMRNLNRPTLFSGITFFSTFMPTGDTCSFGGESEVTLYYYKTGTAFTRAASSGGGFLQSVTIDGNAENINKDTLSLGSGTASSVSIFVSRQSKLLKNKGLVNENNDDKDFFTGLLSKSTGGSHFGDDGGGPPGPLEGYNKKSEGLRAWKER